MPQVQVLHQKYADNPKVVVLAMNVGDENKQMASWWKEKKYGFPTLNDADALSQKYGVVAFPTSVLIDPDGNVVKSRIGSAHVLEKTLEKALADAKGSASN